jgi:nucleoside-diphosphate-sugar epimerase
MFQKEEISMKVLVTGASGKLGPFVIRDLMNAGHEVILFSRRPPADELSHLPLILGDINNFEDCRKAVEGGIEAIHHLAAQPWPVDHPELRKDAEKQGIPFDATMRSNTLGVYYPLMAAVEKKIKIFVMTGSNCALGHGYRISDRPFPLQYLPVDESHPSDVEDSYSYTKHAGEEMLAAFSRAYGIRTYSIRSAGICDEQRRKQMAENAQPITTWSEWMYCWVGSEDVASAHRLLMECAYDIEPHGVYFCNGDDTTALEPSLEILEHYKPEYLPLVKDLPGHASFISNKRLRQVVGWEHKTSWRKHLK